MRCAVVALLILPTPDSTDGEHIVVLISQQMWSLFLRPPYPIASWAIWDARTKRHNVCFDDRFRRFVASPRDVEGRVWPACWSIDWKLTLYRLKSEESRLPMHPQSYTGSFERTWSSSVIILPGNWIVIIDSEEREIQFLLTPLI